MHQFIYSPLHLHHPVSCPWLAIFFSHSSPSYFMYDFGQDWARCVINSNCHVIWQDFFISYLPILQLLPTFASSSVMFPPFLLARLKLYVRNSWGECELVSGYCVRSNTVHYFLLDCKPKLTHILSIVLRFFFKFILASNRDFFSWNHEIRWNFCSC